MVIWDAISPIMTSLLCYHRYSSALSIPRGIFPLRTERKRTTILPYGRVMRHLEFIAWTKFYRSFLLCLMAMACQITTLMIVYSIVCSKKTSKLSVNGLCERISLVTGEFCAQWASSAEMFLFDDVIMKRRTITIELWDVLCEFITQTKFYLSFVLCLISFYI